MRTMEVLLAATAGGFAIFLLFTAATVRRQITWPEWFFTGLVCAMLLYFAVQSARRSRIVDRIEVTSDGFVVHEPHGDSRIRWSDVAGAGFFGVYAETIIDVILAPGVHPQKIRLNLSGLEPPGREFMRQLYRFAPPSFEWQRGLRNVLRLLGLDPGKVRPKPSPSLARAVPGDSSRARPEEMPDFAKARAEARALLAGKDLEDVLSNLDDLERAWKSRLDPSTRTPRTP